MKRRGTKRKFPGDAALTAGTGVAGAPFPDDYHRGLSDFQSAARKRESMRLKATSVAHAHLSSAGVSWEKSLQDKIGVQQKLLEGVSKFMAASRRGGSELQRLEAAKTLTLAKLRFDMLRYELNKIRRGRGSPQLGKHQLGNPSYASVSLSDIRIPLVWRTKEEENSRKRCHKYAVFVIARIGSQIYDSCLISQFDDLACTDITLQDVFLFSRVSPHFEITLEVYAHPLEGSPQSSSTTSGAAGPACSAQDEGMRAVSTVPLALFLSSLSASKTPREATTTTMSTRSRSSSLIDHGATLTPGKLARSLSKAVSKRLLLAGRPGSESQGVLVPKFDIVATVTMRLDDCHKEVRTHELYLPEPESPTCPSFFGQVCCRLAALPYCCEEDVLSGSIERASSASATKINGPTIYSNFLLNQAWASIFNWQLSIWDCRESKDNGSPAIYHVPVTRDSCILEEGDNRLTISNPDYEGEEEDKGSLGRSESQRCLHLELTFSDQETRETWAVHLLQHAADHRRWKGAAINRMDVYWPDDENLKANTDEWFAVSSTLGTGPREPLYEVVSASELSENNKMSTLARRCKLSSSTRSRQRTRSFKRTRSRLALVYNQTGNEDEINSEDAENLI